MKVRDYVLRRLMILPFLVLITTIIVFALMRVGGSPIGAYIEPGMSPDEIDRVEARFGLDDPLPVQYLAWVKGFSRVSWAGRRCRTPRCPTCSSTS